VWINLRSGVNQPLPVFLSLFAANLTTAPYPLRAPQQFGFRRANTGEEPHSALLYAGSDALRVMGRFESVVSCGSLKRVAAI
jgi:hypothetical protein